MLTFPALSLSLDQNGNSVFLITLQKALVEEAMTALLHAPQQCDRYLSHRWWAWSAGHIMIPLGLLHMGLQSGFVWLVHQRGHTPPPLCREDSSYTRGPHTLSISVPRSYITHLSIYRRITPRVGREVSVTGGGGNLASSHVSAHSIVFWAGLAKWRGTCCTYRGFIVSSS